MLDFRFLTFLKLCEIRNYTKTAQALRMTQPAVTQHIQCLEGLYDCKLFQKGKHGIEITEEGILLQNYVKKIVADSKQIKKTIDNHNKQMVMCFGATLSIGEFIMPKIIAKLVRQGWQIKMLVENTESLLQRLDKGELSFVISEGFFDKSQYGHMLLQAEPFVAVMGKTAKLQAGTLSELFQHNLIIREKGSGTRDILLRALAEKNYSLKSFSSITEIGNIGAIKNLVASGTGISFMYNCAAQGLEKISLADFDLQREFNFVYTKNSALQDETLQLISLIKVLCD